MFSDKSRLMAGNESGDAINSTCYSHNDHDGSLLMWGSRGVGRDFSNCEDRPGLH